MVVTYHIAPCRRERISFQLNHGSVASVAMRWMVYVLLLLTAPALFAADGKVIKVLPLYLDSQGRDSLMPSLYERDAYQALLREHKDKRRALRFAVQWKADHVDWARTRLIVETRGVEGNTFISRKIEHALDKPGWFHKWANIDISGKDFEAVGELAAWRVTLWEADKKLGEQKSFLW
jgi:hypothetical protein